MRKLPQLALFGALSLMVATLMAQTGPPRQMKAREAFYGFKNVSTGSTRGAPPRPPSPPQSSRGRGSSPPEASGAPPAAVAANAGALAIRYVLMKVNDGRSDQVDPDTVFSSGDFIKFRVTVNDAAYVYIAEKGSSGTWKILFPDSGNNGANHSNFMSGYADIEIPSNNFGMRFDSTPGVEQIFIAASRQPIADLEQAISGSRKAQPTDADRVRPAMLTADNVPDAVFTGIRNRVQARDLTIEKINEVASNVQEHAIYVANASQSAGPVIVEVRLQHRQ